MKALFMTLNPQEFMLTVSRRMNFNGNDKKLLKEHADWGLEIAPAMADLFYDYLGLDEEMNQILHASKDRVHRLHETFVAWFYEMFTGIDDWESRYANRRWHIGLIHVQIGIGPQHVVPAMATVMQAVGNKILEDGKSELLKKPLNKICMIDLTFIEQAYIEVSSSAVLRETGWSEGLFRRLIVRGTKD